MLQRPMEVLTHFPVRKSKKQKQAFRDAVCSYAEGLGYPVAVEKGTFGCRNVVMGDPETAKFLVTAHYDTCARLPVPNLVTPCSFWGFLGYQIFMVLVLMLPLLILTLALLFLLGPGYLVCVLVDLAVVVMVAMMYVGPANPSNANDNTSGVVTLLEILRTMPENQRSKVCFVLFDLEEAGLIGSAAYRKAHKRATDAQLVLNLDCVGEGENLRLFPTGKLKKDRKKLTSLYKACGYFGSRNILVHEKGFAFYPSDQKNFPYGVGICALKNSRFGLYLGKIHTSKDTVLDQTNVNILRAALTSFLCCGAVSEERKLENETV